MEHYISKTHFCIYYHKSKTSGKYYIGQTNNTKKRWHNNGIGYKNCPHMWHAIQKYGWDDFDHGILLTDLEEEQANIIEQYLIEKFDLRNVDKGYNISPGGKCGSGCSGENNKKSMPVYVYTLDGDYINGWANARIAEEATDVPKKLIQRAAKGTRGTHYSNGYLWSYNKFDKMSPYNGLQREIEEKRKSIYCVDFNGNLIKIYDDSYNIDGFNSEERIRIRQCCDGKLMSACGYFWMFEKDYTSNHIQELIDFRNNKDYSYMNKAICVYDMETGKLIQTFRTKDEASEYTNIKATTIIRTCHKTYHHSGNYLFYYYEDTHGENVEPWVDTRKYRSVLRFHEGKFVKRYSKLKEAMNDVAASVQCAVRSNTHYAHGDIWIYEDDYENLKDELHLEDIIIE